MLFQSSINIHQDSNIQPYVTVWENNMNPYAELLQISTAREKTQSKPKGQARIKTTTHYT